MNVMATASLRLCIFCRTLEAADKPCPSSQSKQVQSKSLLTPLQNATPWTTQDEALLESLRAQASSLCQRCSDYDIVNILKNSDPLDSIQLWELARSAQPDALDDGHYRAKGQGSLTLNLGKISSFHLTPTCQLCRLIYRILPRPPPDQDHDLLYLNPSRWYIRHNGWEGILAKDKSKFAPIIGLRYPELEELAAPSFFVDNGQTRLATMTGETIALDTQPMTSARDKYLYNARLIEPWIDFDIINEALDRCINSHQAHCQPKSDPQLKMTRMIDIIARKVVPYPNSCDYLALSYVWGGVQPVPGALENGTLPQTIEDAITVTQKLGRRYLWVDALCIDQTPNPTPAQAAAKQEQLNIMHLIYSGAVLTIYAISGKDSKSGIAGISRPRVPQTREVIQGHTLFVTPSEMRPEIESSVWNTRAWTFQEHALGHRKLYLSDTHAQLQCGSTIGPSTVSEAFDTVRDIQYTWSKASAGGMFTNNQKDEVRLWKTWGASTFEAMLEDYTSRKLTNQEDSLNACQGILNRLASSVWPGGFLYGLPLHDFPQSLGWTHEAREHPTRRPDFPSWTWAGYEGKIRFPPGLIDGQEVDGQEPEIDFLPRVRSLKGKELTLQGWTVSLDIRTEPFSEVVVPGGSKTIGCVREKNSKHNNTLPSGMYRCLVVARVSHGVIQRTGLKNQQIFMIVLKGTGRVVERQTVITLSRIAVEGKDFQEWKPENREITLI